MNFRDYLAKKQSEFSNFELLKSHIARSISLRKERLVDRKSRSFKGEAAVLLSLVHPEIDHVDFSKIYILLEKRAPNLRHNPGDMAFPGGKMDPEDESPLRTALREAQEEIGLDPTAAEYVGYLDEFVSSSQRVVRTVVCWIPERVNGSLPFHEYLSQKYRPLTEESETVVSVPLAHLLNPVNYSSTPYLLPDTHRRRSGYIRYFDISPFLPHTHIWGLTATIIRRFIDVVFPDNLLPHEP